MSLGHQQSGSSVGLHEGAVVVGYLLVFAGRMIDPPQTGGEQFLVADRRPVRVLIRGHHFLEGRCKLAPTCLPDEFLTDGTASRHFALHHCVFRLL